MNPNLYVIAGPNGAGKSTLTEVLRQSGDFLEGVPLVNPDVIARQLQPGRPEEAAFEAGREALERREELLGDGKSFAVETTLAGRRGLDLIQEAVEEGYETTLFYVGLQSAKLASRRVAQRVEAGGHPVPDEAIRRRYHRSMSNLPKAARSVETALIYDNSGTDFRSVLEVEKGRVRWKSRGGLPDWMKKVLGDEGVAVGEKI